MILKSRLLLSKLEAVSLTVNREASDRAPRPEIQEHPGEEERDLCHRRPGPGGEARLGAEHHRHSPEPQGGHQEVGEAAAAAGLAPWGWLHGDGSSQPCPPPVMSPPLLASARDGRSPAGWVGEEAADPAVEWRSLPHVGHRVPVTLVTPGALGLGRAWLPAPRGVTGPRHVAAQLWPFVGAAPAN